MCNSIAPICPSPLYGGGGGRQSACIIDDWLMVLFPLCLVLSRPPLFIIWIDRGPPAADTHTIKKGAVKRKGNKGNDVILWELLHTFLHASDGCTADTRQQERQPRITSAGKRPRPERRLLLFTSRRVRLMAIEMTTCFLVLSFLAHILTGTHIHFLLAQFSGKLAFPSHIQTITLFQLSKSAVEL